MDDEEARDPFREESGGPWHYSLRQGEMGFKALVELPDATRAIIALKAMSKSELECVVLERLYMWHASKPGGVLDIEDWLNPRDPDS